MDSGGSGGSLKSDKDSKLLRAFSTSFRFDGSSMQDDEAMLQAALLESLKVAQEEDRKAKEAAGSGESMARLTRDSSMDPDVMRAIMASLEDQEGPGTGKPGLARHLSQVNAEAAERARDHKRHSMKQSPEGIFHYGGDLGSSMILSSFEGQPPEVRELVITQLTNRGIQHRAEHEGIINDHNGCTPQLVLETEGDGHCLSHASSLGVWGVHDTDGMLREAMAKTMATEPAGPAIRRRYEAQLARQGIAKEMWDGEWERELRTFGENTSMSDKYMGDVHCFVLANVLRRPLILYGPRIALASGLAGIYLPLLWSRPNQCSPAPACILFMDSHFSLLAVVEGEGPTQPPLVPLSTREGPLPLRFLLPEEEGKEDELLRRFMDCQGLDGGVKGARLDAEALPDSITNLMQKSFMRAMRDEVERRESGGSGLG